MLRTIQVLKVLLLITIGLVLSGCAGKHRRITTPPADLKPSAAMEHTFIMLPSGDEGAFWKKFREGADAAVTDGNYRLKWKLPVVWTPRGQKELMIDAADAKPLGIVLSPLHRNLLQDAMAHAIDSTVPVVVAVDGEDSPHQMTYVGSDNAAMGKDIAQIVAQKTPTNGKIAIMRTQTGMRSFDLRSHALLETLGGRQVQQIAFPNTENRESMKALDRRESNLRKVLEEELRNYLKTNSDVASVVALDENSTEAAWKVLQELSPQKRPQLFGLSVEPSLIKACEEGKIAMLVQQNSYEMGRQSVQSLIAFIYSRERKQRYLYIPYKITQAP